MHVEALVDHGVSVDVVLATRPGIELGSPPVPVVDGPPGQARTGWPTIRQNWRPPSRICSDDAR